MVCASRVSLPLHHIREGRREEESVIFTPSLTLLSLCSIVYLVFRYSVLEVSSSQHRYMFAFLFVSKCEFIPCLPLTGTSSSFSVFFKYSYTPFPLPPPIAYPFMVLVAVNSQFIIHSHFHSLLLYFLLPLVTSSSSLASTSSSSSSMSSLSPPAS